jgi:hypothetical protein
MEDGTPFDSTGKLLQEKEKRLPLFVSLCTCRYMDVSDPRYYNH